MTAGATVAGKNISQAVARGSLTGYRDPAENNPTKNLRLSEKEVVAYGK